MKTLTLLRHAKSGWDDPVARDFDRPLNDKGQRAAQAMGRQLRTLGLAFDHVVASPAKRVAETVAGLADGYGRAVDPAWDKRLYLASAATLLDVTRESPADAQNVLLVAHNPGLEDLALLLLAAGDPALVAAAEEKYPTATLAQFTFDTAEWSGVAAGGGTLIRFIRPRDLDPALGPNED